MGKYILFVIVAVVLVTGYLGGAFVSEAFWATPKEGVAAVELVIEQGASIRDVADQLEEQGVIEHAGHFVNYVRLFAKDAVIQAGTFSVTPGTNYKELIASFRAAVSEEVTLTIPEGYTLAQIGETVRSVLPQISEAEWQAATGVESPLKATALGSLIPEQQDLEGYLFPDTYRFHTDASALDVATMLFETLERRLEENHLVVTHASMTLASIIEREVRSPAQMADVSDIFKKRLEIGMPLQADSTVNYVTGKKTPSVSLDDLRIDSPYNTYKYAGLPPGPISHPGLAAIQAALEPNPNPWFYFLTTPDGEVKYAETFDHHITNRNRFLR